MHNNNMVFMYRNIGAQVDEALKLKTVICTTNKQVNRQ